jgi:hypothetical protein
MIGCLSLKGLIKIFTKTLKIKMTRRRRRYFKRSRKELQTSQVLA